MKRSTMAAIGGTVAGFAGGLATSLFAWNRLKHMGPGGIVHRTPDDLPFEDMVPGASAAVIWGDPDEGAYARFVRFEPGVRHARHTHPHDVTILVLEGAYLYEADGEQIRVGPRSYFFIPAGAPHVSAGDPDVGALFFETSTGPFGLKIAG